MTSGKPVLKTTTTTGPSAPPWWPATCLLAVVRDGGQDGAQRLEAHGDVQQVGGEEEVVEVSEDGHDGVPDQIQEVLSRERDAAQLLT